MDKAMDKVRVAIIGSGNIGTDLMIKLLRREGVLQMAVMVGVDPESDGLARARRMGVATTHEGLDGLREARVRGHRRRVLGALPARARARCPGAPRARRARLAPHTRAHRA